MKILFTFAQLFCILFSVIIIVCENGNKINTIKVICHNGGIGRHEGL